MVCAPRKILAGHFQYHQNHPSTALNLNKYIKSEANLKTHRLYTAKNHMADAVHPTTSVGYRTMTYSYGVCITDKMNMHPYTFNPSAVYLATKTSKQDKKTLYLLYPLSNLSNL